VICPDCDGSGWTKWAAYATEPWTEIIPNLFIGGHDYNVGYDGVQDVQPVYPGDNFDVVVSMYRRPGHESASNIEHHEITFPDGSLNLTVLQRAARAARIVSRRHREGARVLVRCQAGLNRASFVTGLALIDLGYTGTDAVQIIRARRSPWALCNDNYATFLTEGDEAARTLEASTRSEGVK